MKLFYSYNNMYVFSCRGQITSYIYTTFTVMFMVYNNSNE